MSKINYELNTWFLYSIYFYGINLLQSPLTNFRVITLEVQSFELRVLQIEKIPDVVAIHFFFKQISTNPYVTFTPDSLRKYIIFELCIALSQSEINLWFLRKYWLKFSVETFPKEPDIYFFSVMRTLGIPCRSVTNYSSAHDTDNNCTFDKYYDEEMNYLEDESDDSCW